MAHTCTYLLKFFRKHENYFLDLNQQLLKSKISYEVWVFSLAVLHGRHLQAGGRADAWALGLP